MDWFSANWKSVVIPILAFLATYVVGLWLRAVLSRFFDRWMKTSQWKGSQVISSIVRRAFFFWVLMLGALIAFQVSALSQNAKNLASMAVGTIFVLSVAWTAAVIIDRLVNLYASSVRLPSRSTIVVVNILRAMVAVLAVLISLSMWGAPVSPILLAVVIIVFIAGLALRDAIPSYFSGLQIASGRQMRPGDFIRLDSGESGQITAINWQNTQITSLDGHNIIIPNSKLARSTVVNYGHPLKKAADPFHFFTRLHLRELTALKAVNLTELVSILKDAPDAVVYYHAHHFLEEHLYLAPEPANDFAIWVNTTLGNDILAERLASVDTFGFPNMGALKQRLIDVLEDYLRNNPDNRRAPEGEEFHFIRSISYILPTPYVAHDLREFIEILRKVTVDSIYFHIFEARLRLQRGTNDFSIWIADSLGEKDLANRISAIDPYVYTLENLRNRIIEEVETSIR